MARTSLSQYVTAVEAKTRFGQLLDEVHRKRTRFVVERRHHPVAVVIGIEDFEDLIEVGREQADPAFQKVLERARREYQLGRVGSLQDLYRHVKPA